MVPADLTAILALQRARRSTIASTSADERRQHLVRLRHSILAHRQALHAAMWADFHKHPVEVDLTELQPTLAELDHAVSRIARWMRPRRVPTPLLLAGATSEIRYQPRGVVLIMAPWNYPVQLTLTPLVSAIAAGNTAIVRPSEKVPRTAQVLVSIIGQAFEPADVACVVEDGVDLARELVRMPVDQIFFTGSTRVGREIMAAAAANLTPVTLELGDKSPAIVDATADVEHAAARVTWGKFLNTGQTCVAPDYALVDASVLPAFVSAACRRIARSYLSRNGAGTVNAS